MKQKKPLRICAIDFEFNRVKNPIVNLVAGATLDLSTGKEIKWPLHNNLKSQYKLSEYLKQFDVFLTFSAIAECRSFIALGLDPLQFNWIDLFLEYRMMTNHNDKLQWGNQLVNGKVKFTKKPKPKWERTEQDSLTQFKPTHSLAEATYKLTGEIRDTAHKNKMRDLIISDPEIFSPEDYKAILDYNMDDVVFLPRIWERIQEEFKSMFKDPHCEEKYDEERYLSEAMLRGRYAAHTSIMETKGYPIDVEKTRNFSKQVGNILYDVQREINQLFPEIKPFRWNKKDQKFSWNQKATKDWIKKTQNVKSWLKTDGGKKKIPDLSLSLEAFENVFPFKHDYPSDNFGAQMVRFLKMKQSLYGFAPSNPNSDKKTFWDSVGPDSRVRPYMNIYGAQSSRSQPAATGFMFLKPAWMRSLVVPDKGKFICGIDYGAQEFFASGLESGDWNMIQAYLSGDPYFALAKLSGSVPQDALRKDHEAVRDLFKATTLGISYLMTKYGLAIKLTSDTGREWSEDEAQEQIDTFYDVFEDLKEYQEDLKDSYEGGGSFVKLPCGWYMWGDNENIRSVSNVPIQGFGASVMRKAVDLAHAKGIYTCFTLHDALYMEDTVDNLWKIPVFRDCMREAFVFYAPEKFKKQASLIRLDPFAWSPDFLPDTPLEIDGYKVPASNLYLDKRAISEYKKFSKYFDDPEENYF